MNKISCFISKLCANLCELPVNFVKCFCSTIGDFLGKLWQFFLGTNPQTPPLPLDDNDSTQNDEIIALTLNESNLSQSPSIPLRSPLRFKRSPYPRLDHNTLTITSKSPSLKSNHFNEYTYSSNRQPNDSNIHYDNRKSDTSSPTHSLKSIYHDDDDLYSTQSASNNESLPSEVPRGLINLGNTCYMNSAIQSLYSIESLRNLILRASHDKILTSGESFFSESTIIGPNMMYRRNFANPPLIDLS